MIALIDGDIVAYRCSATAQEDPEWVATSRTNTLVEQILHEVGATEYRVFLSGFTNFRHQIYPAYKANRKAPKPVHLAGCKDYLLQHWRAEIVEGIEADDALGIYQDKDGKINDTEGDFGSPFEEYKTIICSIDKDLLQIPGAHYNFVKKEFRAISEYEGLLSFYTSLLVGDATDNIKGCPGIGKAKAPRILEGCETEQDMFDACRITYNDDDMLFLNGHLLYIWRKKDDNWNPERLIKQEAEATPESTQLTEAEIIPSTEHGGTP